jgi:hypothetical protein
MRERKGIDVHPALRSVAQNVRDSFCSRLDGLTTGRTNHKSSVGLIRKKRFGLGPIGPRVHPRLAVNNVQWGKREWSPKRIVCVCQRCDEMRQ